MTIEQIKEALMTGKLVHWSHKGYRVFLSAHDELLVIFEQNNYLSPLTSSDLIDCFVE
jgi:hypothetical protein